MIEVYDLRRLPDEGATIDESLGKEWLDRALNEDLPDETLEVVALDEGRARLQIQRVSSEEESDPVVRVHGHVKARLAASCVRCLQEIVLEVECSPDLTLFPATGPARP